MSDQPPTGGEPPRPWEPGGSWEQPPHDGQGSDPESPFPERRYPRQQLLPQEVKPGRSRKPLLIGLGVVLVLVIGAGVAYLVLRDDGEDNRAAYCAALDKLSKHGNLDDALAGADASTLTQLNTVISLAPDAVADDWRKLQAGFEQAQSGSPDLSQALTMFGALKVIATDATNNCGLDLGIPLM